MTFSLPIEVSHWLPDWGFGTTVMTITDDPEPSTLSSSEASMSSNLFHMFVLVYFIVEVCFAVLFHFYLVPRANQRLTPQPYRDCGNDRDAMLMRILERMKQSYPDKESFQKAVVSFLHQWCEPIQEEPPMQAAATKQSSRLAVPVVGEVNRLKKPTSPASTPRLLPLSWESLSTTATSDGGDEDSSLSSSDDDMAMERTDSVEKRMMPRPKEASSLSSLSSPSSSAHDTFIVPDLGKDEMDVFLAWAFFEKELSQLLDWERIVLAKAYDRMQNEYGMCFSPGRCCRYKPRRLSLEDVNSLWRPLAVYILFWAIALVGAIVLRTAGFQRIVSPQTGLTGWYRPAGTKHGQSLLPLLFFHGIAPAGLAFYIPMILWQLVNDGRAVLMFENTNVSCALGFRALREAEMVQGVVELVDRYLPGTQGFCLCGQSFGSCPLTWLLHAPAMRHRIQQFVLLDPVTILLSEPDVMANFLYSTKCSKIRLMASSELFTEYYLRRHFAWYNSELWLEDIPDSVQVLIALSEKDEIVSAPKVKRHIEMFGGQCDKSVPSPSSSSSSRYKVLFWEEATHAECISSPSRWTEIKQAMLEQELAIARRESKYSSTHSLHKGEKR